MKNSNMQNILSSVQSCTLKAIFQCYSTISAVY